MTNNCPNNTPDEIYNIIEEVHDWRTISSRLMLVLKVIEEDKTALTRKVFLKMYAIYDEWEPIEQSSQIPSEVFADTCTYTMVWDTDKDYEKMTKPLSADYDDFDCDLFYDWDSPDLPAEVIKNADGSTSKTASTSGTYIVKGGNIQGDTINQMSQTNITGDLEVNNTERTQRSIQELATF